MVSKSRVFFLKTVYPGHATMNSEQYFLEVNIVVSEFNIKSNMCAVTSDNTLCCRNAQEMFQKSYGAVVSVNDQCHIADLLMEDCCKLTWLHSVIEAVSSIFIYQRNLP